jgi:hypothetical protein
MANKERKKSEISFGPPNRKKFEANLEKTKEQNQKYQEDVRKLHKINEQALFRQFTI